MSNSKYQEVGILHTSNDDESFCFFYYFEQVNYENDAADKIMFEIWEEGREKLGKFSFILRIMENGSDLKVVDLFPDSKEYYKKKGISRAIILHCQKLFGKCIISETRENNSQKARVNVWERMKSNMEVGYCETQDYYFTL